MSEYVALDVETANADMSSICQIGAVCYSNGLITNKWETLVNPQVIFNKKNISVHGITQDMVKDAPVFPQISSNIVDLLSKKIVASHTHFDRVSITQAFELHNLPQLECSWLDTARVARRTWLQFSQSGFNLHNLAEFLQIDFEHHNALEDARVAGEILHKAIAHTGFSADKWLSRIEKPIYPNTSGFNLCRLGNPNGHLSGQTVVFTGELSQAPQIYAELAANAGCDVDEYVSASTTILVVGVQNIDKLEGYEKSSKQRKAEKLIKNGQDIRILGESDFIRMIA